VLQKFNKFTPVFKLRGYIKVYAMTDPLYEHFVKYFPLSNVYLMYMTFRILTVLSLSGFHYAESSFIGVLRLVVVVGSKFQG